MAIDLSQSIVLRAFKKRWEDKNLNLIIPDIKQEQAPELTARPYAVIRDVQETPKNRTNCSQYDLVTFNVTVWDETPERASEKVGEIKGAIEWSPLQLDSGAALNWIRIGEPIRGQQDQLYSATLPFECFLGRPLNRNPA